MQKVINFKIKGMCQDTSISVPGNEHSYENYNIRITAREDTTLLSVTNEKGTKKITEQNTSSDIQILGNYVGHCVLNNHLILFVVNNNISYITHIEYSNNLFSKKYSLYSSSLNFNVNYPIETIGLYENEDIQKVYWTDGYNHPRVMNFVDSRWLNRQSEELSTSEVNSFNFDSVLTANESVTITRTSTATSGFGAGVVQYYLTYFNKYGNESSIFYTSELLYISHNERGASPEDTSIGINFNIALSNLNTNYQYVRIYSSIRSSIDAVPIVKIVADLGIPSSGASSGTINYIDNNLNGTNVDSTILLYLGCEPLKIGTFTYKNNTLFIGDIEQTLPKMNTSVSGTTYASKLQNDITSFSEVKATIDSFNISLYPYKSQLNRKSSEIKGFKTGEKYRLGVQLQHKSGKWSTPVFLKDHEITTMLDSNTLGNSYDIKKINITASIPSTTMSFFINAGFIAIRPVVVFPSETERNIICQGILCPTVYNAKDRINNAPSFQASWFARPIKFDNNNLTRYDLVFRHNDILPDNDKLNCEIQCNWHTRTCTVNTSTKTKTAVVETTPAVGPYTSSSSIMENKYSDAFFVSQSVLTFHSPDIQFNEQLQNIDSTQLSLRLIGLIPLVGTAYNQDLTSSTGPNINHDIERYDATNNPNVLTYPKGFINWKHETTGYVNGGSSPLTIGLWLDELSRYLESPRDNPNDWWKIDNYNVERSNKFIYFATYPWHRDGSLGNDTNNSGTVSGKLKHKVISVLNVAGGNIYFNSVKQINTSHIVGFNSDKVSLIKLNPFNTNVNTKFIYYGNVDKIISVSNSKLGVEKWYQERFSSGSAVEEQQFSYTGYPICITGTGEYTGTDATKQLQTIKLINDWTEKFMRCDNTGGSYSEFTLNYTSSDNEKLIENESKFSINPISMRYKSTPHLVISLKDEYDSSREEPILPALSYNNTIYNNPESTNISINSNVCLFNDNNKLFYDTNNTIGYTRETAIPISALPTKGFYLAEIIDTNNISSTTKFGGNTEEAYENNTWLPAGPSIQLDGNSNKTITWNEGDTYNQRFDCLRTYPYSDDDQNSIIDIVSFMCETRVNIDGRYDRNRGTENILNVSPSNFNLLNKVYSQQNNYFSYHSLNSNRLSLNKFPNLVSWSKTKTNGELTDTWVNQTLASTIELDGDKGKIQALRRIGENVLVFQDKGISRILFDEKTIIPTSTGVPLELTNSGKVSGKIYLSTNIGCFNKWSICITEKGIYFIDSFNKSIFLIGGESPLDLTETKGFKSWMNKQNLYNAWNSTSFNNFITFYDRKNKDVYFVNKNICLVYSEILGEFTSFMNYEDVPLMTNISDKFVAFKSSYLWEINAGEYNNFFGTNKDYSIKFAVTPDGFTDKIFNNIEYRADVCAKNLVTGEYDNYLQNETFNSLRVENEYQDTGEVNINQHLHQSNLRKKFKIWRIQIPRDSAHKRDRIRNPWCYVTLKKLINYTINSDARMEFHNMGVYYFE